MENTLDLMREELSSLNYVQKPSHNLTFGEHIALMNLKENNSLVINKADKGSTVVVQNDPLKQNILHSPSYLQVQYSGMCHLPRTLSQELFSLYDH